MPDAHYAPGAFGAQRKRDKSRERHFPPGWTPAHSARLDSWLPVILAELRPDDPVTEDADGSLHSGSIVVYDDHWHRYSAGTHGGAPVGLSLVVSLLSEEAGHSYATAFLATHPGLGAWQGIDTEAGRLRAAQNAERALFMLSRRVPVLGTPAERYLIGERGIPLRSGLTEPLGYLADARPQLGHGAFVGVLTDSANPLHILGLQVGFLEPRGEHIRDAHGKRMRRIYYASLDPEVRHRACFYIAPIPLPAAPVLPLEGAELAGLTIIAEGLENALALAAAAPYATILGLPGIGRLGTIAVTGAVTVMRDNDGPDAPATKSLGKGLDALMLAGVDVKVTDTPPGKDAADFAHAGELAELRGLILAAEPAKLTRDGELERLARLSWEDYQSQRIQAARSMPGGKWSLKALDAAVKARWPEENSNGEESFIVPMAAEPVTDISAVLDTALAEVRSHVDADDTKLATLVLWALHTFIVHRDDFEIPITPRLYIGAMMHNSGKTTALMCTSHLCRNPRRRGGITPASYLRTASEKRPTLCLDEIDKLPAQQAEAFFRLFNSGHSRAFAEFDLTEKDDEGRFQNQTFDAWGAMVVAGNGKLPDAAADSRCISIQLRRARPGAAIEHMERFRSPVLETCALQFARWCADLTALPKFDKRKHGLFNRTGDNWEPLLQLASLAGPAWQARAIEAAQRDILAGDHVPPSVDEALMTDLAVICAQHAKLPPDDPRVKPVLPGSRIASQAVVEELLRLQHPSGPWAACCKRGPADVFFLRAKISPYLVPPGFAQWHEGNQSVRGFYTCQLQDMFDRYGEKNEKSAREGENGNSTGRMSETDSNSNDLHSARLAKRHRADTGGIENQPGGSQDDPPADPPSARSENDPPGVRPVPFRQPGGENTETVTAHSTIRPVKTPDTLSLAQFSSSNPSPQQPPVEKLSRSGKARNKLNGSKPAEPDPEAEARSKLPRKELEV